MLIIKDLCLLNCNDKFGTVFLLFICECQIKNSISKPCEAKFHARFNEEQLIIFLYLFE